MPLSRSQGDGHLLGIAEHRNPLDQKDKLRLHVPFDVVFGLLDSCEAGVIGEQNLVADLEACLCRRAAGEHISDPDRLFSGSRLKFQALYLSSWASLTTILIVLGHSMELVQILF
jgi:hypothetical protein